MKAVDHKVTANLTKYAIYLKGMEIQIKDSYNIHINNKESKYKL